MASQHHIGIGGVERLAVHQIGCQVTEVLFEPGSDQPFVDTRLQLRHKTNLENGADRCGQAVGVTWYSVRCILQVDDVYEERITLWSAASFDEAIEFAEAEADEYVLALEGVRLGLSQAFHLFDAPGSGVEIFSLMRTSDLEPDDYLSAHFDTGGERQLRDEGDAR